MNKTNKQPKNVVFKVLIIMAFGLIFAPFNTTLAAYGSNVGDYFTGYQQVANNPAPAIRSINPSSSNVGVGTKTVTIIGSGFIPSSVARINGSNRSTTFIDNSNLLVQISGNDTSIYRTNGGFFITVFNEAPGGGYSNSAFFTINKTTTTTNINNNSSTNNTFSDTNQTTNTTSTNTNNKVSNLASNAIFGTNSFWPSGLIQWIIFAIIILLIIIFVRKVFGAEERYHASPLKHE